MGEGEAGVEPGDFNAEKTSGMRRWENALTDDASSAELDRRRASREIGLGSDQPVSHHVRAALKTRGQNAHALAITMESESNIGHDHHAGSGGSHISAR